MSNSTEYAEVVGFRVLNRIRTGLAIALVSTVIIGGFAYLILTNLYEGVPGVVIALGMLAPILASPATAVVLAARGLRQASVGGLLASGVIILLWLLVLVNLGFMGRAL